MLLVFIGNLAFSLASLVFGIRLCLLARRTRELPELLLGVSFLFGGFLANTLGWVLYTPLRPEPPLLGTLFMVLRACVASAGALLLLLAWRVFRPHSAWAGFVVVALWAVLVSYVCVDLRSGRTLAPETMHNPLYWAHSLAVMAPYFWLFAESLHYQALIRRRWRIGLPADLVVAARMRFWAIGMGAEALMFLTLEVIRVIGALTGKPVFPALLVSALGVVCTGALWMAFFLPESQRRRIQRQAASPPAA